MPGIDARSRHFMLSRNLIRIGLSITGDFEQTIARLTRTTFIVKVKILQSADPDM